MSHILHKFLFIITVTTSLALVTSPSYAKEEGEKKPKTSTMKKDKTSKDKKETSKKKAEKTEKKEKSTRSESSKKESDSASKKGSEKSGKKAEKSDEKPAAKGANESKDKGDKNSKSSQSDDSSSQSTKKKISSKPSTTASKAKKQYKNITVNLNKADAKTFSHYLMGIGEKRAKAIVAYRTSKGKFKDIKELLKVEGIGDKIFDGLKKNISLSTGETSPPKGGASGAKK